MILVDVYMPSIDSTYDFMLDENVTVEQIITEMIEMISKKVKETKDRDDDQFILCNMSTGQVLDFEKSLFINGIRDGAHLILV